MGTLLLTDEQIRIDRITKLILVEERIRVVGVAVTTVIIIVVGGSTSSSIAVATTTWGRTTHGS